MLIFDFDGVLVESVDIKTRAFQELFSFAPNHIKEIVGYHTMNAGISRFEKFRHIYTNILHEELTDEKFQALSDRFSSLVIDAVVAAPCVPGARGLLRKFSGTIPMSVISATPEEELREIIRRRRMDLFFTRISGSPAKKADNIHALVEWEHLDPGKTIYIGDAINDLNAALQTGVRFIGRIRPGVPNPFAGRNGVEKTVHDLNELSDYIGSLV
ncbi:MAG: Phosphoglycolate phosphatase [Methanoregula sp. PtaU1.Bin051]|nr:MAG: Phosphoglycolate phosphatase [Methanoregula sp. PtaU1.Bin051]